jgi:hypothetical protein
LYRKLRTATNLHELFPIALKFGMLGQRSPNLAKYSCRVFVRRINQAVMHPLPFTPGADDLGSS